MLHLHVSFYASVHCKIPKLQRHLVLTRSLRTICIIYTLKHCKFFLSGPPCQTWRWPYRKRPRHVVCLSTSTNKCIVFDLNTWYHWYSSLKHWVKLHYNISEATLLRNRTVVLCSWSNLFKEPYKHRINMDFPLCEGFSILVTKLLDGCSHSINM